MDLHFYFWRYLVLIQSVNPCIVASLRVSTVDSSESIIGLIKDSDETV